MCYQNILKHDQLTLERLAYAIYQTPVGFLCRQGS